jgi:hypothetical protein
VLRFAELPDDAKDLVGRYVVFKRIAEGALAAVRNEPRVACLPASSRLRSRPRRSVPMTAVLLSLLSLRYSRVGKETA